MNYIELINNFWKVHREQNFSPVEIALYFYLLDVSNSLCWKNPFNHTNTFIIGFLGISEKTLITARKTLEDSELIEFIGGNGRRYSSSYLIKGCNNSSLSGTLYLKDIPKGNSKGCNSSSLSDENDTDNNKLNQTKQNIINNNGKPAVSQHKLEEIKKKESIQFQKPTLEEVTAYCKERGNTIDPQQWIDHYTANGWKVGKNPMRDWKAAVRTWERNGITNEMNNGNNGQKRTTGTTDRPTTIPGNSTKKTYTGTL